MRVLLIAGLAAAGLKLGYVQGFQAQALSAKAEKQRSVEVEIPAHRGAIVDRNGVKLAFSVESRALAFRPNPTRKDITAFNERPANKDHQIDFDTRTAEIAAAIREVVGASVDEQEILTKLRKDASFTYLLSNVEPAQAREIRKRCPEITEEYRAVRDYPGRSLASNIVGVANWRMDDPDRTKHNLHGLSGLEKLRDNDLFGTPGRQVVDTEEGADGVQIPGTARDIQPAVNGSDIELTIDADLQYFLQDKVTEYAARAKARSASAVILDAHTGEVYALANDKTFDPTAPSNDVEAMGNPAVSTPYEPGSVNKIVTALSAIEYGITTPDATIRVPGEIKIADRVVHDAWSHGTVAMSTTGVFAKSSNVGTLMLANQVGPDRFADMLQRLGLGQRTGVGLPGESPGQVPARGQWSGSTFGNLPIGQGLSMTVLQMAGMYQTVANDGVRVPPRIIRAKVNPDGTRLDEPRPDGVRVVSPETAKTVRDMLRAVVQKAPRGNNGTAPAAALAGYQVSGKTGTAQQVDPSTKRYSDSKYWITFGGILPADDPRFVVGIVLDQPAYGSPDGTSAAPLFHEIASFLAQRYSIPMSKEASPIVELVR
jgi:cell division protein FtsI (penicillin-binding protein 3)